MNDVINNQIRENVRENYKKIALKAVNNDSRYSPSCCSPDDNQNISIEEIFQKMGYSINELKDIPNGSNMGLGCGNPQAIADLQ